MAKIKKESVQEVDVKTELKALLVARMPGCFDREPNSGVNVNVSKLVEEILAKFQ